MDEGILNVIRAGGCRCDPPGSGEQFCTGHCALQHQRDESSAAVRRQRVEIERLRAALQLALRWAGPHGDFPDGDEMAEWNAASAEIDAALQSQPHSGMVRE